MEKYSCEKHIEVSGLLSVWEHDCWWQFCFIKLLYKAHRTMDRTGTGDWNENKWIMRSRVSCFILSLFVIFQEFKLNYVIYVQMKTEQTFIFVFCVNPISRTVTRIYCIYSLQFQLLAFCKTIQYKKHQLMAEDLSRVFPVDQEIPVPTDAASPNKWFQSVLKLSSHPFVCFPCAIFCIFQPVCMHFCLILVLNSCNSHLPWLNH